MDTESFCYQFRNVLKDIPKISLLGIRGYGQENKSGIYDDAIIRNINGEIKIFSASVDPGKYYIDHPLNPQGCARLKAGLWTYGLGEHHTREALIQVEEVAVDRIDRTGKRTGEEHGWYGINIHSGGPEYLVGRYSAGCQVIRADEAWKFQWLEFFEPIKKAVLEFNQRRIPYLLIESLTAIPA